MNGIRPVKANVIKDLPPKAIYVVPINFQLLRQAVRTAADLGRHDVTFVTPIFLEEEALAMVPGRPIKVDPLAHLDDAQKKLVEWRNGSAAAS